MLRYVKWPAGIAHDSCSRHAHRFGRGAPGADVGPPSRNGLSSNAFTFPVKLLATFSAKMTASDVDKSHAAD